MSHEAHEKSDTKSNLLVSILFFVSKAGAVGKSNHIGTLPP